MHTVILHWTCKPGVRDGFLAGFEEQILVDTRARDGFVSHEVLVDQDNPDKFTLFDKWSTRAHFENYMAWRTETGALEMLAQVLAAPLEVFHYDAQ